MSLSSLHRRHAEICEQMADKAKTAEARQQWNDLAAELRHKADLQDGLIAVTPPDEAKHEEAPASEGNETEQGGPSHAEPSLPQSDLGSESEATPSEPTSVSAFKETEPSELGDAVRDQSVPEDMPADEEGIFATEHQPADSDPKTPEEAETSDSEWEALIANIRSNGRPNKPD